MSHIYFLIDNGSLESGAEGILALVSQILVSTSDQKERITWDYDIQDMRIQKQVATVDRERTIQHRSLDAKSIRELAVDLERSEHKQIAPSNSTCVLPALEALHSQLMCLEADVNWGDDPTQMKSPRGWRDPTRNERLSTYNQLFIISHSPTTVTELFEFVHRSTEPDTTFLNTLTQLRDNIIGMGVWENYARRRIGVSWVSLSKYRDISEKDPIDILIESTISACLSALGGSLIFADLLGSQILPFSNVFGRMHRKFTCPGWSHKFAREISSVVDMFSIPKPPGSTLTTDLFGCHHGAYPCNPEGAFSWMVRFGSDDTSSEDVVRLIPLDAFPSATFPCPTGGRLVRRYDLPELVAVAESYKRALQKRLVDVRGSEHELAVHHLISLSQWPRFVRLLESTYEPTICRSELMMLPKDVFAVARSANAQSQLYAIVPMSNDGNSGLSAVYCINNSPAIERSLLTIANVQTLPDVKCNAPAFYPDWMEDWKWKSKHGIDTIPNEPCSITVNVSFDMATNCSLFEEQPITPVDEPVSDLEQPNDSTDSKLALGQIKTLKDWFEREYLTPMPKTTIQLKKALDTLSNFVSCTDQTDIPTIVRDLIRLVLLDTTQVEDPAPSPRSDDKSHGWFIEQRHSSIQAINDGGLRDWQLSECKMQILLHLFVLDLIKRHSQNTKETSDLDGIGHNEDELVNALRDHVDSLCIWATVDDIGTPAPTNSSTVSPEDESLQSSGDLAGSFINGKLVTQFSETLATTIDELRVQCGWIPVIEPRQSATNGDNGKQRRKGTPRKLAASRTHTKSEVIVSPQREKNPVFSGYKLARHLDELISTRSHSASSSGYNTMPAGRQPRGRKGLPPHLLRKIKSEVVASIGKPSRLSRSSSSAKSRASRRKTTVPMNKSTSGDGSEDICLVPETPTVKRRRTSCFAPMGSSSPSVIPTSTNSMGIGAEESPPQNIGFCSISGPFLDTLGESSESQMSPPSRRETGHQSCGSGSRRALFFSFK